MQLYVLYVYFVRVVNLIINEASGFNHKLSNPRFNGGRRSWPWIWLLLIAAQTSCENIVAPILQGPNEMRCFEEEVELLCVHHDLSNYTTFYQTLLWDKDGRDYQPASNGSGVNSITAGHNSTLFIPLTVENEGFYRCFIQERNSGQRLYSQVYMVKAKGILGVSDMVINQKSSSIAIKWIYDLLSCYSKYNVNFTIRLIKKDVTVKTKLKSSIDDAKEFQVLFENLKPRITFSITIMVELQLETGHSLYNYTSANASTLETPFASTTNDIVCTNKVVNVTCNYQFSETNGLQLQLLLQTINDTKILPYEDLTFEKSSVTFSFIPKENDISPQTIESICQIREEGTNISYRSDPIKLKITDVAPPKISINRFQDSLQVKWTHPEADKCQNRCLSYEFQFHLCLRSIINGDCKYYNTSVQNDYTFQDVTYNSEYQLDIKAICNLGSSDLTSPIITKFIAAGSTVSKSSLNYLLVAVSTIINSIMIISSLSTDLL